MSAARANVVFLAVAVLCLAALPFFAEKFYVQFFAKILIMGILAMSLDLLIGLVDTFGKVVTLEVAGFKILPELSSMTVYVLMAVILLWRPEGLFGKRL